MNRPATPEQRARMKASWADPEVKARRVAGMKASWALKKASRNGNPRPNDPTAREKVRAALSAMSLDHFIDGLERLRCPG